MANSASRRENIRPSPGCTAAAPPRRSLWARLRNSRFLFISIIVHVIFGLVAAIYVVQVYSPARKLTFKGGPPSPNRSERSIEHKVQMAKKQSTMSAPAVTKRIVTTGIAKVTLPDMPDMPQTNDAAPMKMAGVGGAGIGAPTALTGGEGSQGGGGPISFFGLRETGSGSFAGTLYDLKQTQTHRSTDMTRAEIQRDRVRFHQRRLERECVSEFLPGAADAL